MHTMYVFCTMCILESERKGNGFTQTFDVNHLAELDPCIMWIYNWDCVLRENLYHYSICSQEFLLLLLSSILTIQDISLAKHPKQSDVSVFINHHGHREEEWTPDEMTFSSSFLYLKGFLFFV